MTHARYSTVPMPARGDRGKFAPGQSGNPGGRPKGLSAALRAKYGDDAKTIVAELHKYAFGKATDVPPIVRFNALKELLDRGWGKAPQTIEHTGDGGGPVQIHHHFAAGA